MEPYLRSSIKLNGVRRDNFIKMYVETKVVSLPKLHALSCRLEGTRHSVAFFIFVYGCKYSVRGRKMSVFV